jgi:tRNA pseudouridine38-40 synthase
MQQGAADIIGTHDFTSFAASDPDLANRNASEEDDDTSPPTPAKTATRSIFASTWHREGEILLYRVTGSGFLHHMVRNLVGTFVDVGRGRTASDALPNIIAARTRSAAGSTAPPQGLFLVEVDYDSPSS